MAGWLRTFLLIFAAAHIAVIAINHFFGPFDPFKDEGQLSEQNVALGTGFYGVLFGLLAFAWFIFWLIIFLLLRNSAERRNKQRK